MKSKIWFKTELGISESKSFIHLYSSVRTCIIALACIEIFTIGMKFLHHIIYYYFLCISQYTSPILQTLVLLALTPVIKTKTRVTFPMQKEMSLRITLSRIGHYCDAYKMLSMFLGYITSFGCHLHRLSKSGDFMVWDLILLWNLWLISI